MKGRKDLSIITDIEEEKKVASPVKTRRNDIIIQHLPSTTSTATHRYYQSQIKSQAAGQLQLAEEKKKEEERVVKTFVKHENNMEIFITDAPDVDFDQMNEEQTRDLKEKFEMVEQQS